MASTVAEVPPAVFLIFHLRWLFDWSKSVTCLSSWLLPQSWNDTIWQGVFSFLTSTASQQQQQQHPGHGARWQSPQPTVCTACASPACHPSQKSLLVNARSVFERQASILLARTCLPIWKTNFHEPLFASSLRQFGDQKHGLSIYLFKREQSLIISWQSADKVLQGTHILPSLVFCCLIGPETAALQYSWTIPWRWSMAMQEQFYASPVASILSLAARHMICRISWLNTRSFLL